MIFKWSKHNMIMDLEYVRNSQNDYLDKRGQINNFELTEPINLIGLIYSKKMMRANHFHPQQEQKCLFVSGQIIEVYKSL